MIATKLFRAVLIITIAHYRCVAPLPHVVQYIGIGYNIIDGNPEGDGLTSGGVDVGLKVNRRILKLTEPDEGDTYPPETEVVLRDSASQQEVYEAFQSSARYQKKLSSHITVSGGYNTLFAGVEFAASAGYTNIATSTSDGGVIYFSRESVSNLASARYRTELACHENYELEAGFVADACRLPNTYDQEIYMNFLKDWGTHVVIELDLGTRSGSTYKQTWTDFVKYASTEATGSVSVSGSFGPYSASLTVDVDSFDSNLISGMQFKSAEFTYNVGSSTLNEPIRLTLMPMNEVFRADFWAGFSAHVADELCSDTWNLLSVATNVLQALRGYADYRHISSSSDAVVQIPLTWPDGTYGLPMPQSGCPNTEFTWTEGTRYQDTGSSNSESNPLNLAGYRTEEGMEQKFCIKTTSVVNNKYSRSWPAGSYCIYRKGGYCPNGFQAGFITWDDEGGIFHTNENTKSGFLPDGIYNDETKIYFCCREDGVIDNAIFLPTSDAFYLLARFQQCQKVHGMAVTQEYFYWNTDVDKDYDFEPHPHEGKLKNGIGIYYCYYQQAFPFPAPHIHSPSLSTSPSESPRSYFASACVRTPSVLITLSPPVSLNASASLNASVLSSSSSTALYYSFSYCLSSVFMAFLTRQYIIVDISSS